MLHVAPEPEPSAFNAAVRIPGGRALLERAGKASDRTTNRYRKVADSCDGIPARKLPPLWRACLPDLYSAYLGICSYAGMRINRVTGTGTADHYLPKDASNGLAYEWSNYRLACPLLNARKGNAADVLDPFDVQDDWFEMEFTFIQVRPRPGLSGRDAESVQATIDRLGLNSAEFLAEREAFVQHYADGNTEQWLRAEAPFVYHQMYRAGVL